ncbi:membrane-anchored ubiquitin-fold protein 3-like [Henckelia pumila]|uniref:membrane-anchored ubiquitin-fold protein 3-like n=1 Tax=Henckelia pumila TaxID=405737 RepID=UPI003C6DE1BF
MAGKPKPQPQPQTEPQPPQTQQIRFRIFDGTDICHGVYPLSTTIDTIKERLLAEWPQGKSSIPTSVDEIKLMHAGRYLVGGRTLGESRLRIVPGQVVTILAIVQPPEARQRTGDSPVDVNQR